MPAGSIAEARRRTRAALRVHRVLLYTSRADSPHPTAAAQFHNAGIDHLKANRIDEAAVAFANCRRLDGTAAACWAFGGVVEGRAQRRRANLKGGEAAASAGANAEMVHMFRTAASLEPLNGAHHANVGSTLMTLERPREAEHALRAALALPSPRTLTVIELGKCLVDQARDAMGVVALRDALRAPRREEHIRWTAEVDGRLEEAVELLQPILGEDSERALPDAWATIIVAEWLLGSAHAAAAVGHIHAAGELPAPLTVRIAIRVQQHAVVGSTSGILETATPSLTRVGSDTPKFNELYDAAIYLFISTQKQRYDTARVAQTVAALMHSVVGDDYEATVRSTEATSQLAAKAAAMMQELGAQHSTDWFRVALMTELAVANEKRRATGDCPLKAVSNLAADPGIVVLDEDQADDASTVTDDHLRVVKSSFVRDPPFAQLNLATGSALSPDVYAIVLRDVAVSGQPPTVHDRCRVYRLGTSAAQQLLTGERDATDRHATGGWGPVAGRNNVDVDNAALLSQPSSNNWFHWITEALVRAVFMKDAILADPTLKLVVPDWRRPEQGHGAAAPNDRVEETLQLMGIEPDRLVRQSEKTTVRAQRLLVVDWRPHDDAGSTYLLPPPDGMRRVRSELVPHFEPAAARSTVVWVSRNEGNVDGRRVVTNEQAVIDALRKIVAADPALRLHIVRPTADNLSVADAVDLFSHARLVVGVHGAGLTNAMFCAPGTPLVEVTLPEAMFGMFAHLAEALQLPYHAVDDMIPHGSFYSPVDIDVDRLASVVQEALQTTMAPAETEL